MNPIIDMDQYDVVVTFKDGHQLNGRCSGNPLASTPLYEYGVFDMPFLLLDTCMAKTAEREYDTGYLTMIRTEDISMIQVKKVIE